MNAGDKSDSTSSDIPQPVARIATPEERAWERFRVAALRYQAYPIPENYRVARRLSDALLETIGKP